MSGNKVSNQELLKQLEAMKETNLALNKANEELQKKKARKQKTVMMLSETAKSEKHITVSDSEIIHMLVNGKHKDSFVVSNKMETQEQHQVKNVNYPVQTVRVNDKFNEFCKLAIIKALEE